MSYSDYVSISDFGNPSSSSSDPLAVCAVPSLEGGFNNKLGSNFLSKDNKQCQSFMAGFCGQNWDGVCEYLSKDEAPGLNLVKYGVQNNQSNLGSNNQNTYTKGQILIRNAASERFLVKMSSNCVRYYEPFDPTTANSPLISTWIPDPTKPFSGQTCVAIYDVDEKTIDRDVVMNKLLDQPFIGIDILVNIFVNRLKSKTLYRLKGTRIYDFFMTPVFLKVVQSKKYQ